MQTSLPYDFFGGCSALSWHTQDGKHLWGRNFDFNRLAEGTKVTFVPRGLPFYTCGTTLEHDLVSESRQVSHYAALGIGTTLLESTPALYEGVNECGLMGGQLYYRNFAHFAEQPRPGTLPLQPPFAVTYLLSTCATIEQVVDTLRERVTLVGRPILGMTPTLHWSFCDRTGETLVVESDADGLHLYRNTIGVMTNSPGYLWHRQNLLNYVQVRDLDYDTLTLCGDSLRQCFSGSGALGLPGDWSSPSRFVRLAYLKKYAVLGKDEAQGVCHMLRLFGAAAFPLGMVRVSQPGTVTPHDTGMVPYDYTIYTCVACAESQRFYWTTYDNPRIFCADLRHLLNGTAVRQFDLNLCPDIQCVTQDVKK